MEELNDQQIVRRENGFTRESRIDPSVNVERTANSHKN